jgi:hypothetical protein
VVGCAEQSRRVAGAQRAGTYTPKETPAYPTSPKAMCRSAGESARRSNPSPKTPQPGEPLSRGRAPQGGIHSTRGAERVKVCYMKRRANYCKIPIKYMNTLNNLLFIHSFIHSTYLSPHEKHLFVAVQP